MKLTRLLPFALSAVLVFSAPIQSFAKESGDAVPPAAWDDAENIISEQTFGAGEQENADETLTEEAGEGETANDAALMITAEKTREENEGDNPAPAVTGPKLVVSGSERYLKYSDGSVHKKWFTFRNGNRVYCRPSKEGRFAVGVQKIGDITYLFSPKGYLITKKGPASYEGRKYLVGADGALKTGWYKPDKKSKMYFSEKNFAALTGFRTVDGERYYFNTRGILWTSAGLRKINGDRYYCKKGGAFRSGWVKVEGKKMYFSPKTYKAVINTRKKIDGKTYFFNKKGAATLLTEGFLKTEKYAKILLKQNGGTLSGVYNWAVSNISYAAQPVPVTPPKGYTREEYYFTYAFETQTGNCFNFAAPVYWAAKALGLKARLVEGRVGMRSGALGPHGWVEIYQDGTTYICDPDCQYETGTPSFMVPYGAVSFTYYPDIPAY